MDPYVLLNIVRIFGMFYGSTLARGGGEGQNPLSPVRLCQNGLFLARNNSGPVQICERIVRPGIILV